MTIRVCVRSGPAPAGRLGVAGCSDSDDMKGSLTRTCARQRSGLPRSACGLASSPSLAPVTVAARERWQALCGPRRRRTERGPTGTCPGLVGPAGRGPDPRSAPMVTCPKSRANGHVRGQPRPAGTGTGTRVPCRHRAAPIHAAASRPRGEEKRMPPPARSLLAGPIPATGEMVKQALTRRNGQTGSDKAKWSNRRCAEPRNRPPHRCGQRPPSLIRVPAAQPSLAPLPPLPPSRRPTWWRCPLPGMRAPPSRRPKAPPVPGAVPAPAKRPASNGRVSPWCDHGHNSDIITAPWCPLKSCPSRGDVTQARPA